MKVDATHFIGLKSKTDSFTMASLFHPTNVFITSLKIDLEPLGTQGYICSEVHCGSVSVRKLHLLAGNV